MLHVKKYVKLIMINYNNCDFYYVYSIHTIFGQWLQTKKLQLFSYPKFEKYILSQKRCIVNVDNTNSLYFTKLLQNLFKIIN